MATGTSLAFPYPIPTTSRSSPTTTSAVNEKRRPPLTTLATRLISTTRSCRSKPDDETVRSRAMSRSRVAEPLKGQPASAHTVGQRLHPSVVLVAAAVEDGGLDSRRLGALRQQLPGPSGLIHRRQAAQLGFRPVA